MPLPSAWIAKQTEAERDVVANDILSLTKQLWRSRGGLFETFGAGKSTTPGDEACHEGCSCALDGLRIGEECLEVLKCGFHASGWKG